MKLQKKLIGMFGVVTLITLLVALLGYWQVRRLGNALYEIGVVRLPSLDGLSEMNEARTILEDSERTLLVTDLDPGLVTAELERQRAAWVRAETGRHLYEPLPQTDEEARLWRELVPEWQAWNKEYAATVELLRRGHLEGSPALLEAGRRRSASTAELHRRVGRLLSEITSINREVVAEAERASVSSREDMLVVEDVMLVAAAVAVTLAAAVGLVSGRALGRPMVNAARRLTEAAKGGLGQPQEDGDGDELAEMEGATSHLVEALRTSEARLKAMADNLPDSAVYQVVRERDGTMRFVYLSAGIERLNAIPASEILEDSSRIYARILAEDRAALAAAHESSARTLTPLNSVVRMRRGDEVRWMRLCSNPRRLPDGRVLWDGIQTDITDAQRAEEALRKSDQELRMIFDNAPVGIALVRDRRYIRVNAYHCETLGYTPEEFLRMGTRDIYMSDEDYRAAGRDLYETAAKQGFVTREFVFRRKDGSPVHLQVRVVPVDRNNIAAGIISMSLNVTERVRAEEALMASEARLREVFDHTNELIFVLRVEESGRLVFESINRAAEAFGLGVAEFCSGTRTPGELLLPKTAEVLVAECRACLETGRLTVVEQEVDFPAGRFQVTSTLVPVFDPWTRRALRIVGFVQDITERKNAERELRASEEKYRGIFENATEGIFRTSPEGRALSANPALARMHGYDTPEEMIATVTDLATQIYVDPEDRVRVRRELERTGSVRNYELKSTRKDGSTFWVLLNVRVVRDASGHVLYYEGTSLDITERKNLFELREAKVQAEAANRAKSVFLANMSHEIRTPMNAILGFSQLMLRDPELTAVQRERLGVIDRNGEHLMALIDDILEMSKIEANRTTLVPGAFSILALAKDLEFTFRAKAEAKGLEFSLEVAPGLPEAVQGDAGKLRQILTNLLSNAVKFTERGRIALRLGAEPREPQGWILHARVDDTGPGIPGSEIGRLFRHFEQTEVGRRTGTGTGLGLAISREFARMMDGDVTVESIEGTGSTFRAHVWLSAADPALLPESGRHKAAGGPFYRLPIGHPECRVLVVDDLADSRQFLRQLLVAAGFAVREASDGAEAVVAYGQWRPQAILMDLRMPVMGGMEAIRQIRADPASRDTRIICLTASAFVEDRRQVIDAGADTFMSKPVHAAELFGELARLLGLSYEEGQEIAPTGAPARTPGAARKEPPRELLAAIRSAVVEADLDRALGLVDELAAYDEEMASRARSLVTSFEYSSVLALVAPGGSAAQ